MKKYDYQADFRSASDRAAKLQIEKEQILDSVIDGLGFRDAYPNTEHKETISVWEGYGMVPREQTRIIFGRDKFLSDVRLAAAAHKGSEAVDRLSKALKAASK